METLLRSTIKEHPSNPRRITDAAKKKIRDGFKSVGMLQPPIVNNTTGYLLSGHQRIAILDGLEHYKPGGAKDYMLDVAVVELGPEDELRMLAFLNNQDAMGTWDTDKLAGLALDQGIDMASMGFDKVSLEIMFEGDSRFEEMFAESEETQADKAALDQLREARIDGPKLTEVKKERADYNERREKEANADFYVVVVCNTVEEKQRLLQALNIPVGEQYISPDRILEVLNRATA